ncbi:molybdopterin-guanine dinucleotide biosynthesis protein MobB [Candidatus Bathyarchaeota archaeon]|nr:molybdopterin-guanine dinucleotide biosynthesis protein MobB [Candidatus Bathyarchaeota archaeon]
MKTTATVIAVLGSKESGKTTTIEALTRELTRRGYKVAAVKHIPERDFTIEQRAKTLGGSPKLEPRLWLAFHQKK